MKDFLKNVLVIVEKLYCVGYEVYIVGGCVCDLLFGKKLKDFDILINVCFEEV